MARKTAEQLRREAKELLRKAEELENARAIKIGKLVLRYEAKNWEGFSAEMFKAEVAKIL